MFPLYLESILVIGHIRKQNSPENKQFRQKTFYKKQLSLKAFHCKNSRLYYQLPSLFDQINHFVTLQTIRTSRRTINRHFFGYLVGSQRPSFTVVWLLRARVTLAARTSARRIRTACNKSTLNT